MALVLGEKTSLSRGKTWKEPSPKEVIPGAHCVRSGSTLCAPPSKPERAPYLPCSPECIPHDKQGSPAHPAGRRSSHRVPQSWVIASLHACVCVHQAVAARNLQKGSITQEHSGSTGPQADTERAAGLTARFGTLLVTALTGSSACTGCQLRAGCAERGSGRGRRPGTRPRDDLLVCTIQASEHCLESGFGVGQILPSRDTRLKSQ